MPPIGLVGGEAGACDVEAGAVPETAGGPVGCSEAAAGTAAPLMLIKAAEVKINKRPQPNGRDRSNDLDWQLRPFMIRWSSPWRSVLCRDLSPISAHPINQLDPDPAAR
jgi:hypothetical protein